MSENVPYTHEPASQFLGTATSETEGSSIFTLPKRAKRDARVAWSHKTAGTLRSEANPRLKEIERNVAFFNGDQWARNRAPWKNAIVVNYCSWICEQWTALLCDNKPRFVYESLKLKDEPLAEIATAIRSFDEMRDEWDRKREEAVLISRVKKESYLTPRYDRNLHGGEGGITIKVISPENVFMDKRATSIDDCETFLYEYEDSPGSLMSQYPKLKLSVENSSGYLDRESTGDIGIPAQASSGYSGGTLYSAPRHDSEAERPGGGSSGVKVREWWLRPKGKKNEITLRRARWSANNKLATRKKFFKFANGDHEPMQYVITEGNVVYELPMSVAAIMQFASDELGSLHVLDVHDSVSLMEEDVKVPKYPAGRRLVIVGDHVADDGGNPFSHCEFPFVHIRARVNGRTKKAMGDIDLVYRMQEYLNRLVALLLDAAILTSNPVWIVPVDEQLADEDLTNAPGAIIRTSPMAAKLLRREQGVNMPSYLMQLIQFIVGQIREISGLSETATGGKFKGQQSAETVSMYQESASVRFRQAIRLLEQAEVRLGRQYLGLCTQFYAEPLMAKVKNALGIDKHVSFLGSSLSRDMTMKAKAGSGLPSSPSARMNTVMALYGEGLIDMPEVYAKLQETGAIDSAGALLKRIQYYIAHPQEAWKMPQLFAQLNGQKTKGKSNKGNAGRSARSTTANKARAA
jgi:hypothetical protein